MELIAMINNKGGVGKTSSTISIGSCLTRIGKRVLLIDWDPQSNLTSSFGFFPEQLEHTGYELIKDIAEGQEIQPEEYLLEVELGGGHKLSILPANMALSGLEKEVDTREDKEFLLKKALSFFTDSFDYCLIDCQPTLAYLTIAALVATKHAYVPTQTEFYALSGLVQITRIISVIKEKLNPELNLSGIFGTKFSSQRTLHKDVLSYLKNNYGDMLMSTVIRDNIDIAVAPSHGKSVVDYAPKSNGAQDYMALTKELLAQHEKGIA